MRLRLRWPIHKGTMVVGNDDQYWPEKWFLRKPWYYKPVPVKWETDEFIYATRRTVDMGQLIMLEDKGNRLSKYLSELPNAPKNHENFEWIPSDVQESTQSHHQDESQSSSSPAANSD